MSLDGPVEHFVDSVGVVGDVLSNVNVLGHQRGLLQGVVNGSSVLPGFVDTRLAHGMGGGVEMDFGQRTTTCLATTMLATNAAQRPLGDDELAVGATSCNKNVRHDVIGTTVKVRLTDDCE